jgi:hypothetical protein
VIGDFYQIKQGETAENRIISTVALGCRPDHKKGFFGTPYFRRYYKTDGIFPRAIKEKTSQKNIYDLFNFPQ